MSAVVLFVEIDPVPGQRDEFLARVREHRGNVIKNEPGCQRFDISVPDDGDDKVRLYEVYADQAALEIHRDNPQLGRFRDATSDMVTSRRIVEGLALPA